jgi:hypothetical protein
MAQAIARFIMASFMADTLADTRAGAQMKTSGGPHSAPASSDV